ncbi:hypothetical protein ACVIIW_003698 [Bradyrhizobium sp. USDA 4449]
MDLISPWPRRTRAAISTGLCSLVRRQIKCAQRLVSLTGSGHIQLRRYEKTVEIDA